MPFGDNLITHTHLVLHSTSGLGVLALLDMATGYTR
jgi:hypothetical protein